jgi:hypothetical protein
MTQHWLERPGTIRTLWIVFIAILAATLLAELFVERHSLFGLDGSFGFYAWFGFAACVGLILFPKLLGVFLKRPDTYYVD